MISRRIFSAVALTGAAACLLFGALPAMASASVTLNAEEAALASGAKINAVGSDLILETEGDVGPTWECNKIEINGEVGSNGTEPATVINNTGSATECEASNGAPVLITGMTVGTISFFADHTDSTHLVWNYDVFVGSGPAEFIACSFEGTVGTTWTGVSNVDTIVPSALTRGAGSDQACPVNGSIRGHLALTSGGSALEITG
jgi:hypothetical protein